MFFSFFSLLPLLPSSIPRSSVCGVCVPLLPSFPPSSCPSFIHACGVCMCMCVRSSPVFHIIHSSIPVSSAWHVCVCVCVCFHLFPSYLSVLCPSLLCACGVVCVCVYVCASASFLCFLPPFFLPRCVVCVCVCVCVCVLGMRFHCGLCCWLRRAHTPHTEGRR